ncbi:MAG: hypothetical protein ACKVH8_23705 [Pirellulales bacterium]
MEKIIPGWIKSAQFTPDGHSIAILSGTESIKFLDSETGVMTHEIGSTNSPIDGKWNDFAMATASHKMVTGGVDKDGKGSIEIWEFERGNVGQPEPQTSLSNKDGIDHKSHRSVVESYIALAFAGKHEEANRLAKGVVKQQEYSRRITDVVKKSAVSQFEYAVNSKSSTQRVLAISEPFMLQDKRENSPKVTNKKDFSGKLRLLIELTKDPDAGWAITDVDLDTQAGVDKKVEFLLNGANPEMGSAVSSESTKNSPAEQSTQEQPRKTGIKFIVSSKTLGPNNDKLQEEAEQLLQEYQKKWNVPEHSGVQDAVIEVIVSESASPGDTLVYTFNNEMISDIKISIQGPFWDVFRDELPKQIAHLALAQKLGVHLRWAQIGVGLLAESEESQQKNWKKFRASRKIPQAISMRDLLSMRNYPSDPNAVKVMYIQSMGVTQYIRDRWGEQRLLDFAKACQLEGPTEAIQSIMNLHSIDVFESAFNHWADDPDNYQTALVNKQADPYHLRVIVYLDAKEYPRDLMNRNIGHDDISIYAAGFQGIVNGKETDRLLAVLAHKCRLLGFTEVRIPGKSYWRSIFYVPQGSGSDGSNRSLTQQRIDELRGNGAKFQLDHIRTAAFPLTSGLSPKDSPAITDNVTIDTEFPNTKSLAEATAEYNRQSADARRELFKPAIPDLTVKQLQQGFQQTAEIYRKQGKKQIAYALQQIADSGRVPLERGGLFASGVHTNDKQGQALSRQIAPCLILPDSARYKHSKRASVCCPSSFGTDLQKRRPYFKRLWRIV